MLKSKLRKTGVYLHLRTRSLENACYSSTTCPTLSTLFYKVCPKTVRRSVPFLPRFARFYSILLYIGGAKTHFFAGKKFFAPPRRKCGFRRQFSTKTAENSHPAGGKSARFSDVSRACFTAENPREKSVGNSGFSRGFRAKFTQFSSLLYREILWCEIVRAAA